MDCATCALAIEKQVKKICGVKGVGTALMLDKIFVEYDESKTNISEIMKVIDKMGYSNYLVRKDDSRGR
ncbi:MAG: heavy metal-associated domain-containing protein [Nitrososphaeria archaeon]|jgi:Cu+-exporting ATPase